MENNTGAWPTDIKVRRAEKTLDIVFNDGTAFSLPAEYLRVESPSAEVQGHGPGQKVLVAGRRHVGIADVEAIGNEERERTMDFSVKLNIFPSELKLLIN